MIMGSPKGKFIVIASYRKPIKEDGPSEEDYVADTRDFLEEAIESANNLRETANENNLNPYLYVYDDKGELRFMA